jgi:type I restriction enzyme R subunit
MTRQSEQILENNLVQQLTELGYSFVEVKDEQALLSNLKSQLEKHNKETFSKTEFAKILNHLNKGNIFDRAKTLRDKFQFTKDDGTSCYIEFINMDHWCQNQYQVTNQVTIEGSYKNRYDVTLLINGIPLVQIELKRRGLEMKEAFNQINRYQRHSFWSAYGLFNYVQLFVISNGVNTKYYANNRKTSYKQTFYWSDKDNKRVSQLSDFTNLFLEKCHLSKMITRYIVLHETDKILMILRPYQYHAVEKIIEQVKNSKHNGYIWHTTGSGKTLTSFKASQIIMRLPTVEKVVFCVDRNDLDYQTMKEFNNFKNNCVDGTDNTKVLVEQFADTTPLIVTTIQKLNTAISKTKYLKKMEALRDKKIVFIFDECHRSQFGDTHLRITEFFNNHQLFGFTGTPIFAENAAKNELGKRTTKDLFDECLHKYVITDAIGDENVLKFSIEYVGRYKNKADSDVDIEVEAIDTKELLEADDRLDKISDYIIRHHKRKTHSGEFTAMFCVSSVEVLISYYKLFAEKKEAGKHKLKIATIFSYTANEADKDANGDIEANWTDGVENKHTREKLDEFMSDYNQMFTTKYSTKDSKSFGKYYKDIANRVKKKQIDILLVVNMFLTGFDSKALNTLYVDKNLRYHGLIQAYSRTNRILGELKSQGNIVAFRNLKKRTDEAIILFSNKEAIEEIIIPPYDEQVSVFNETFIELIQIAPTHKSVDDLRDENEELEFVKKFREIMRTLNVLQSFVEFDWEDIGMTEQQFENYKSKYLDLYDKVRSDNQKEVVSVLDEVDFELELIHRDEINVAYILTLLAELHNANPKEKQKKQSLILDAIAGQAHLRSKKELIEKFIEENLPKIKESIDIPDHFDAYWDEEKRNAFGQLCKEEGVVPLKLDKIIQEYLFTGKAPLRDNIISSLETKPSILQRKPIGERILTKMMDFVDTFINGVPTKAKVYDLPGELGMVAEE